MIDESTSKANNLNMIHEQLKEAGFSYETTLALLPTIKQLKSAGFSDETSLALLPAIIDIANYGGIDIITATDSVVAEKKSVLFLSEKKIDPQDILNTTWKKKVDDDDAKGDEVYDKTLDFFGNVAGIFPLGNIFNAARDGVELIAAISNNSIEERDRQIREYTDMMYGNNTFMTEYPPEELTTEGVFEVFYKLSSLGYLTSINSLNENIFSGHVNKKEFEPQQQDALKQLAAYMTLNAFSMLGYSHAAELYLTKDYSSATKKDAIDWIGYYEHFIQTRTAGDDLFKAIDEAFRDDKIIDASERLNIRGKMIALNSAVIDLQPGTYKNTDTELQLNGDIDYKKEMEGSISLAMFLSEDSIISQIEEYKESIDSKKGNAGMFRNDIIGNLFDSGHIADAENEEKNRDDNKIRNTEQIYNNANRFFNAYFQDMYPSLYKKSEAAWKYMNTIDYIFDPSSDWTFNNREKASDAYWWWNFNENSINVDAAELPSFIKDFLPRYKSIFSRDYIDDAVYLLNSGKEMEELFEQCQIIIAANGYMDDFSEFGDSFESQFGAEVEPYKPEMSLPLRPLLSLLLLRESLNPFSIFSKQRQLTNDEIEKQQIFHNSMENLLDLLKWKRHAQGGRADEVSIFGEAGPEWAIPERHDARTAELLNSAREASGFSWTELIASTGGLNAGGNVVNNNFTYAPVVHANDARGVEQTLNKDKQFLNEWWEKRQWEMARSQWA